MASAAQLNVLNDAIFVLSKLGHEGLSEQLNDVWELELAAQSQSQLAAA